jgi:Uma2 family endonuclease
MTAARSYPTVLDWARAPSPPKRKMTEAEFVAWCDSDTWAEWVNGEVILMSPVDIEHAELSSFLQALLKVYVDENDLGKVLSEPFQIRFGEFRRRRSPDILFVASQRSSIIQKSFIDGAPDLIVEIVSLDSQSRDRREKYLEYMAAGVREYWIVDPLTHTIEAHKLNRARYRPIEEESGKLNSSAIKGFYLKPDWLWRAKLPKVSAVLRELAKSKRARSRRSS